MKKARKKDFLRLVATHLSREEYDALKDLARLGMRSVSAEMRIAVKRHAGLDIVGGEK